MLSSMKEEILFMSYVEVNNSKREDMWFRLGLQQSHVGNRQWFSNIDEAFRHSVKLNNNAKMGVMGKGNIRLEINGSTQVATDVYYVLALKNNLLSIGQLQERGLAIIIQNGECKLYHLRRGLIIQTKMTTNRMFVLLANVVLETSTCLQIVTEDNSKLWHCRFGHLSYKGLRTLQYKEMVKGLPLLRASTIACNECFVGKQHINAIPKKS
ncbi:hypothetical protein CK203_019364 [Vitis vinifera]|uniref:Uncharacterized protein n=1 Tax=Vitis vinifera TaxID=29760 RepID=A0A438IYS0_VITVI|nr:hypothetical protein CK203_019364 [Vitis vinifera]